MFSLCLRGYYLLFRIIDACFTCSLLYTVYQRGATAPHINGVYKMSTMTIAHSNAQYGVDKFGGVKSDYFAEALRLAHEGINLVLIADQMADNKSTTVDSADRLSDIIFTLLAVVVIIGFTFGSMAFVPIALSMIIVLPCVMIGTLISADNVTDFIFRRLCKTLA